MNIQHVSTDYVNQVWPKVADYIESALAHQDDYTLDQAKVYLTSGQWVLIVAVADDGHIQGAAAISFSNRPNDRVAFVIAMGGKLITGQETFLQFKDLLKVFGATYIEGASRETAARLWLKYGLEEKYRIVGAKL
jgi:hypothetical protein